MKIRTLLPGLALLLAAASAGAASLTLVPSATTVAQNGSFTVNLVLAASDAPGQHPGKFGGAIVLGFDQTKLQFNGFVLDGALDYFEPLTESVAGNIRTLSFGFDNAPDNATVGTFTFKAIAAPGSIATLDLEDADDFSGSFASYVPTYQRFYPAFVDTQVTVSAVPLPGAAWLLGTGVGALALRRLRRPRG